MASKVCNPAKRARTFEKIEDRKNAQNGMVGAKNGKNNVKNVQKSAKRVRNGAKANRLHR